MRTSQIRVLSPLRRGLFVSPVLGALALCGFGASNVEAATYFSDGFEDQTDPLTAPDTGVAWRDIGSGDNHALITSPVFAGTTALQLIRNGTANPGLIGVGTAGGLVGGNVLEYIFHINQVTETATDPDTSHNFNNPIQINIGFSAGGTALATFGTLSSISENYFVTDSGSPNVNTGVTVPRNTAAYDSVRLVLTLTNPTPTQLGGTFEIFIDADDADGVATTSRGVYDLNTVTIPVFEPTNPSIRIARGPTTSISLYDDISISQVPEPASLAIAALGGLLMIGRSRRPA